MRAPSPALAALLTLAAAAVWGTSFIANDLGLAHTDAVTFTALRFVVGAASAWLVLLVAEPEAALRPPWRSRALWAFGLLNALAFLLQYVGQERTSPARAALFVNANVFTVALLQVLVRRERVGAGVLGWAAVAVLGVALLTTGGDAALVGGGRLLGDVLAFGGGAAFAAYIVLQKGVLGEHSPLSAVTWTFVATALVLAPLALPLGAAPAHPVAWGAILYTGLFCSTLAYLLWSWGLGALTPTASAVVLLVEVPVATSLSVALGLDLFTPATALGALLLFSGVAGASLLDARRDGPPARGVHEAADASGPPPLRVGRRQSPRPPALKKR